MVLSLIFLSIWVPRAPAPSVFGYVNRVIPGGGKYSMLANPLNTSSNTLGGLLTGSLTYGSKVLVFNPTIVDYDTYTRVAFGNGWSPAAGATVDLSPGRGVLIHAAPTAPDVTNTFVGEVLQGSLTNRINAGYTFLGNKVPESGNATAIGLTTSTGGAAQLGTMDVPLQDFSVFTRVDGHPWSPNTPVINVADGFYIQNFASTNWVRNFTVGGAMFPQVTNITVGGGTVLLAVENPTGGAYDVKFSTNIQTWITVATNQTGDVWSGILPNATQGYFQVISP
jgi:hypothetical protein